MALDIHAHLFPTSYVEALIDMGGASRQLGERLRDMVRPNPFLSGALPERLDLLDRVGIRRQVLSITSQWVMAQEVAACSDHAAAANDALAEVCSQYPDRFGLFANLPLVDADAALRELERSRRQHNAVGVIFPTHVVGKPLDWDGLEPVYAALERLEVPIFLHPVIPPHVVTPPGYKDYGLVTGLYFPMEDARALLRMVCGGVLERHPRLRVICPHLGGGVPFLVYRLDLQTDPVLPDGSKLAHPPSYYLRKVLYDTVSRHLPAMRCVCETLGARQMVLGTDFPYVDEEGIREIMGTIEALDITPAERAGILEDNVKAWVRPVGS